MKKPKAKERAVTISPEPKKPEYALVFIHSFLLGVILLSITWRIFAALVVVVVTVVVALPGAGD